MPAIALTSAHVLTLVRSDLYDVLEHYPEAFLTVRRAATQMALWRGIRLVLHERKQGGRTTERLHATFDGIPQLSRNSCPGRRPKVDFSAEQRRVWDELQEIRQTCVEGFGYVCH